MPLSMALEKFRATHPEPRSTVPRSPPPVPLPPCHVMSAASAAADPPSAAMPTAVVPAGEAAALLPVLALPTPQERGHVAAFYNKCLAAYSERNHQGSLGRSTACDKHHTYAITDLAAQCAVRAARAREREEIRRITPRRERAPIMMVCVSQRSEPGR